jgi:ribosomal protein L11 methylase PrmA
MESFILPSSFRDPSGFVFIRDQAILRQINMSYHEDYDQLVESGLLEELVEAGLLIPHIEIDKSKAISDAAYKVIQPERIPFMSYPYEWCFGQLKAAALASLTIQRKSLEFGMSLKDCSSYNIQFKGGKPLLIDTLSFEKYHEGQPWTGYRQFCQHFLAPLALMSYKDVRLNQLLRIHIDGISLDLASKLLPMRASFSIPLFLHIHLHAKSQNHFANEGVKLDKHRVSKTSLLGLIDSLEAGVRRLEWSPKPTSWAGYYEDNSYSPESLTHKKEIVSDFLDRTSPRVAWDMGANTGLFSRIASRRGAFTIAFDSDPACTEKNYLQCVKDGETNILPLVLDLTNPSSGGGWENSERAPLFERGPADTTLALALVHHLAIGNNLPFQKLGSFFWRTSRNLIIEFVPKSDPQVQRLLQSRKDIFSDYTRDAFEAGLSPYFTILEAITIKGSERRLYLMERKSSVQVS